MKTQTDGIIDLELHRFLRESSGSRREMARCFERPILERIQERDRGKVIQFPRRVK
jgi:hypothetical protein